MGISKETNQRGQKALGRTCIHRSLRRNKRIPTTHLLNDAYSTNLVRYEVGGTGLWFKGFPGFLVRGNSHNFAPAFRRPLQYLLGPIVVNLGPGERDSIPKRTACIPPSRARG